MSNTTICVADPAAIPVPPADIGNQISPADLANLLRIRAGDAIRAEIGNINAVYQYILESIRQQIVTECKRAWQDASTRALAHPVVAAIIGCGGSVTVAEPNWDIIISEGVVMRQHNGGFAHAPDHYPDVESHYFRVAYRRTLRYQDKADPGTVRICIEASIPNFFTSASAEYEGDGEMGAFVEVEAPPLALPSVEELRRLAEKREDMRAKLKRIEEPGRIQAEMTQQVINGDPRLLGLLGTLMDRIG